MLKLYQSNRIEYLADLLVEITSMPLNDPFAAETIVVAVAADCRAGGYLRQLPLPATGKFCLGVVQTTVAGLARAAALHAVGNAVGALFTA